MQIKWTTTKNNLLREQAGKMPWNDLAARLGVTEGAARVQARRLGIRTPRMNGGGRKERKTNITGAPFDERQREDAILLRNFAKAVSR